MTERKLIAKRNGYVDYMATYEDHEQVGTCTDEEWEAHIIKTKLINEGADENTVNSLFDIGYSIGYDAAEEQAAENV